MKVEIVKDKKGLCKVVVANESVGIRLLISGPRVRVTHGPVFISRNPFDGKINNS